MFCNFFLVILGTEITVGFRKKFLTITVFNNRNIDKTKLQKIPEKVFEMFEALFSCIYLENDPEIGG